MKVVNTYLLIEQHLLCCVAATCLKHQSWIKNQFRLYCDRIVCHELD